MVSNDIYNSKEKYENYCNNFSNLTTGISNFTKGTKEKKIRKRKYICVNPANIKCFTALSNHFEIADISYIRRLRVFRVLIFICNYIPKDLVKAERDDIDEVIRQVRRANWAISTQREFIMDCKFIWRTLFPEKDNKGRVDETITPYPVRHLSGKVDKSKEKRENTTFKPSEFERLLSTFSQDTRIQAFLALSVESLGRPQELLYLKIKNITIQNNYAEIEVTSHGKEGCKLLRCIDSFFYVSKWLNEHPLKNNPEAYFFINLGKTNKYEQMTIENINKHLRIHCTLCNMKKITSYDLKRSGITLSRLRGDSDADIQHRAGWTSTKQLKVYDYSSQRDSFKRELVQRGLMLPDESTKDLHIIKVCVFCRTTNGFAETICIKCKRPLDTKALLKKEEDKEKRIDELTRRMDDMQQAMGIFRSEDLPEVMAMIKEGIMRFRKKGEKEQRDPTEGWDNN